MKTVKETEAKIQEIEDDEHYKSGLVHPATITINTPLALIQLEMETRRKILKWVLS